MNYEERLINVLMLSSFYKEKPNKERFKYLLLEPIIIISIDNAKEISKQELIEYINELFDYKTNVSEKIVDYFHHSSNSLKYNKSNKSYSLNILNNEINNKLNEYRYIYLSNQNKIKELKSFILDKINKELSLEEDILESLYKFFMKSFTVNDKDTPLSYSDIDKNIANVLSECYEKRESYIDIFKNIVKGMAILKSIQNYKNSNFIDDKKPIIYLDNIFISNIFGWCEYIYFDSALLILETLKEFKFDIAIHEITIDLILEHINNARNIPANSVDMKSSFYYMVHFDYSNKKVVDIMSCPLQNIQNIVIRKIEENNIKIKKGMHLIDIETNKELCEKIHRFRKNLNEQKGDYRNIKDKQTLYDATIIKCFNKNDRTKINKLSNMQEIFLTYQRAIINNTAFKTDYTLYNPIMNVNAFMNLLLLETIISNISNIKLIDIFIINSYSPILSSEFMNFINKTLSETSFNEEEKDELLALINDKDRRHFIIENGIDHKKTLTYIREREKEKDKKIEETNKKVEETNIENEKIRKDKEKSESEKNKVLKENERLINIIKKKEIGDKIDKYHNIFRKSRERKIKRRNIKITKTACVILISALIFILEFIIFKNIDTIKIFMEKYFGGIMEFNADLFKCISIVVGIFFIVAFTFIININNIKNIVNKNKKKSNILQNKDINYHNRDVNNFQGNTINNYYGSSNDNNKKEDKEQ